MHCAKINDRLPNSNYIFIFHFCIKLCVKTYMFTNKSFHIFFRLYIVWPTELLHMSNMHVIKKSNILVLLNKLRLLSKTSM